MIRILSSTLMVFAAGVSAADDAAPGDNEEMTDMEFLEYLGSWDGVDAEWELFESDHAAAAAPTDDANADREQEQEEVEDSES